MDKLIFLDTETTGLDEEDEEGFTLLANEIHSIVELAAIVDIDGKIKGRFEMNACPFPDDEVDPKSVEINGMSLEEIKTYPPQSQLLGDFKTFLEQHVDPYDPKDKLWVIAYNAEYDMRFLRTLWSRLHDKYFGSYFWVPPIDIMQAVAFSLVGTDTRNTFPNFKLFTVAERFGIKVSEDKIHRAMYDVRLCRQIFYKMAA